MDNFVEYTDTGNSQKQALLCYSEMKVDSEYISQATIGNTTNLPSIPKYQPIDR